MLNTQMLSQALQVLGLKFWTYNPSLGTYADEGIFSSLGHMHTPAQWEDILNWIHPEDRSTLVDGMGELLSEISPRLNVEIRLLGADQHYYWRSLQGAVILSEDSSRSIVGFAQDIHQRRINEEKLHQLATKDNLTGIYNKTMGMVLFERLRIACGKNQQSMRCFVIEICNLKSLNDMHGIECGNQLLQTLCEILRALMHKSDLICRLEGATLLLAQAGQDQSSAELWMDKVDNKIQEFNVRQNLAYALSIKWGLSDSLRPAGDRSETLVARARQNLLHRGRNRS